MFTLKLRMYLLVTVLFGIIYAVIVMIGLSLGIINFYFYLFLSLLMMFIQYMIGPYLVEWMMHVRYIKREDNPQLYQIVEDLANSAGIPMPKVGIAYISLPNAFAFGRSLRDGRVCVTEGILRLLNKEELKAVLGHEISHLKNRDVLVITLLSVIPMVMYRIAWQFLFYRPRQNERQTGYTAFALGMVAFLFYFITNLLVLYASRIREYFADRGSVLLGNPPSQLASSLYKLVYGSSRINPDALKQVEGLKAFFVNDPSCALKEVRELKDLDLDRSGTIEPLELEALSSRPIRLSFVDKLFELLSTHPNMLKRIKRLCEYKV
ncbi:MAG: zinc metalloprotease HtpX [Candidatus Omnitrophica bacterium]|nr:zinc metalloprotease HtpX [Candidatus Omnitrophota bacterium]